MLIIKYNLIASFNKKLSYHFVNNTHNASLGVGEYYGLPLLFNGKDQLVDFALNTTLPPTQFVYLQIGDVDPIYKDPVGFLRTIEGKRVKVLYTVTDPIMRMESLIKRVRAWDFQPDVDYIIRRSVASHIEAVNGEIDLDLTRATYENVILLEDFKDLLELHLKGKIELVPLSKQTIIETPEKIFKHLDIPFEKTRDPHLTNLYWGGEKRMTKSRSPNREEFFARYVDEYGPKTLERYDTIMSTLCQEGINII